MALLDDLLKEAGLEPPAPPEKLPESIEACKTLEELELYLTWCSTPRLGSRALSSTVPPKTSKPST